MEGGRACHNRSKMPPKLFLYNRLFDLETFVLIMYS